MAEWPAASKLEACKNKAIPMQKNRKSPVFMMRDGKSPVILFKSFLHSFLLKGVDQLRKRAILACRIGMITEVPNNLQNSLLFRRSFEKTGGHPTEQTSSSQL